MRILIANKFYYRRGGDCTYAMALEEMLREHGHDTAVLAMQYPDNEPSVWQQYFPSEIKFKPGPGMIEAFRRPLGTAEVKRKFTALLDAFQPDIVHLNNIHSQLSPIIARIAHSRGVKVVWTLHDYKLLCPRYDCLGPDGKPCEACFTDKRGVLSNRCMKGSLVASTLAWLEARKWDRESLEAWTDAFVCPSRFMASKMEQGGFDPAKLHHLYNFIDPTRLAGAPTERGDYYCYVGRLSHEKGIETLIQAASRLPFHLKIVGGGPLEEKLRAQSPANVEFLGYQQWPAIKDIVARSRMLVAPSEWYENNPFSVIEALCLGTPVVGADIGGIPELITPGYNGEVFGSGDSAALAGAIERVWEAQYDRRAIADAAIANFDADSYYHKLIKLYNTL